MPPPVFRLVQVYGGVGEGTTDSFYATVGAIIKDNCPRAPYCIPNEMICGRIAGLLRLPVPPFGLLVNPQASLGFSFASLNFNLTSDSLPPVNVDNCIQRLPDLSTGLMLFDILVANSDRHTSNFSLDLDGRMTVFDHSHALFGGDPGEGLNRLTALRNRLGITGGSQTYGIPHCLLDKLSTDAYFDKWLSRIEDIADFQIDELCSEQIGVGINNGEAAAASDFLKYRRSNLREIVRANRAEFHGIMQWGLLL